MEINQGVPARASLQTIINKHIQPQTDLPPGQKMKLAELKALVDDNDSLKNLLKQEEELINKLLEHCDTKKNGLCANNTAAARDILCTGDAMTDLVCTTHQPPLPLIHCIHLVRWLCPPHWVLWLSVAMVMTDVFQKNGFMVSIKLLKP
jgi:hypothetical protein